ncbi:MAG: hypothetical protein ABJC09_09050 [Terriglobia bacterium]
MYFSRFWRRFRLHGPALFVLFPAGFLALSACRNTVTEAPPRYVVLRFENLSGDESLEWAGRAASEYLSRSLAGAFSGPVLNFAALSRLSATLGPRPANVPGISAERTEALVAGATRLITGYVERSGGSLRIAADEFDVKSGRSIRSLSASDATVLGTLSQLSRKFSPAAQPYLTSSAEALRLYVAGLEGPGDQAVSALELSLQADASFGPAWTLLVNANLARGNREAAKELIAKARRRKLDLLDQANLNFSDAVLRNDRSDRLTAMRQISNLSPGDTVLQRSVAQSDADAGDFEHAAEEWNKLAAVLPDNGSVWNQLGYARAFQGNYQSALAAVREYARLQPNDPNPLDSTGDIHYLFRKYSEAAASYLAANAKSPEFQLGGELYKAAWAKFNAGDKTGADAAFAQFKAVRLKAKAPGVWLFEADWLYRTGRKKEALAIAAARPGPEAKSQIAVWDLLAGDRSAAARAAAEAGQARSGPEFLVRFVTLPSASAEEWKKRAERMIPAPEATQIRLLAVGYALLLDDKAQDAVPVWTKIVEGGAGTDFFSRAILARLNGGKEKLAILPQPNAVNEFAAVLDQIGR